ncbi:cupin domain-containing protein [Chryseobacterium phosphatilyticum]|uniref:Cupin domain-containing protein n=1 Tax=Chryseobacterium phosphatilyticum TaxID=475075 RepID=A0A316XDT2_9FLAO|nr:cupin domain-containing protein [Chryseobacterium phosphatilyticum]PWN72025.1 cupin domain-containing protein [Chryseobacterium phosphatilyticum]
MRTPKIITAVVVFVGIFFSGCKAQEVNIKRKDLQNIIIDGYLHKVEMQEIILDANQGAPVHYHPCPVVGIVISGKILFQMDGEDAEILNAGDVFYEPKDRKILCFENVDANNSAKFVATYLKESNEKSIELTH